MDLPCAASSGNHLTTTEIFNFGAMGFKLVLVPYHRRVRGREPYFLGLGPLVGLAPPRVPHSPWISGLGWVIS